MKFRRFKIPFLYPCVAPLAGAWIEMLGIKEGLVAEIVAPLAGAWIEMTGCGVGAAGGCSRTPRGCVD